MKRQYSTWLVGLTCIALGGCAPGFLAIKLQPVNPTVMLDPTLVIDQRSEASKVAHLAPKLNSSYHVYIADKDTLPMRMDALRYQLGMHEDLRQSAKPVTVHAFDILWDTSGTAEGLALNLDQKGIGMLGTTPIGNGINDFTCSLDASFDGREARKLTVVKYTASENSSTFSPEVGAAAQQCVSDVIDAWLAEVVKPKRRN